MKQCGRFDLPKIEIKPPLSEWDTLPPSIYFGDLSPNAPHFLSLLYKKEEIAFVIGPEAGLTEKEEEWLKQKGAKGVKLSPWTLRTDTAPLVALAYLSLYTHHK